MARPLSQLLDGPAPAQPTPEQVRAALNAVLALSEAIRDLRAVPSGVLYAHVMGTMTIQAYEWAIARLKGAGLVTEDGQHMLRWAGPEVET